jgi:uncharacterized membrane protein YphA (DoxX/SURF4 family)
MNRILQPAVSLFAIGLLGLGVLALVYHDFALVWQPVAPWVPGRTALAYGSGVLMLGCGVGLLFRATALWAVRILFPYLILWMLLKVPALFVAPGMEAVWLGFGEVVILLTGGWILWGVSEDVAPGSLLAPIAGSGGLKRASVAFGLALLPVGLSHLVYIPETVGFVPAWLPARTFWACLTGAGQIACGLGILFGVFPRVAAWCEAGMVSLFTLLVWLPMLVSKPGDREAWTGFFISWILGSAAWVVAQQQGVVIGQEHTEGPTPPALITTPADERRLPLRQ